ncbi:hypothetical protein M0802_016103, partial [Mischocyttarus mexicanus]
VESLWANIEDIDELHSETFSKLLTFKSCTAFELSLIAHLHLDFDARKQAFVICSMMCIGPTIAEELLGYWRSLRPSQQTSKLKRRIVKPLIVSPFSSASSEKDVRMNENVAPSLDIRMDPDRILMKAMKDITIVEEDKRRSANLKGEVSGSMKRHLASAAEAIALAREKRREEFEDSADSTITALKFELQRMEERQKALEKRNRLLEREVDKLRKEGKNDSSKKKSGSCYKNALPQRAKRLEKWLMPRSNNEARIDSLVASVATLATAIVEIQRQVKSLVKPRDSCEKSVATSPPSALAKRQDSFI